MFLGLDAAAEPLRESSTKALKKPARGGAPNALFGVLPLAEAPGEVDGFADALTVLLPWGSLLEAVACARVPELARLRGLCRDGAAVRLVYGYGSADGLALPSIDAIAALTGGYRAAGFEVKAKEISREEIRALGTTWAGRLAFSGAERRFVEISGRASLDGACPEPSRRARDERGVSPE